MNLCLLSSGRPAFFGRVGLTRGLPQLSSPSWLQESQGGPPSLQSRSLSLNHAIGSSLVTRLVVSSFCEVIGCTPWKTAGPGSVLTPAESSTLPCRKSVAFSFVWSAIPTSISILLFLLFFLSYEFIMTSSQYRMLFRGPGSSYSGKFNTLHVEVFFLVSLSPLAPSSALGLTIHSRPLLHYYWTCTFTKVLLQLDYTSSNRLLPTCLGQQLNMLCGKPWHPYQLLQWNAVLVQLGSLFCKYQASDIAASFLLVGIWGKSSCAKCSYSSVLLKSFSSISQFVLFA